MGMYDNFGTDKTLEVEGVWTNYGEFRVKIAHTGGANKAYLTLGEQKMKPFRRAIENGTFPRDRTEILLFEIFAHTIVKGWEVNTGEPGEEIWSPGIEGPDGDVLPFTPANVEKTFKNLPALFYDVKEVADSIAAFRAADLEDDAKNS